jgi:hypothetical protein
MRSPYGCPHAVTPREGYDGRTSCSLCGRDLGWYCPRSPDHLCHYFSDEGRVELLDGESVPVPPGHDPGRECYEWCLYCRQPEERK